VDGIAFPPARRVAERPWAILVVAGVKRFSQRLKLHA